MLWSSVACSGLLETVGHIDPSLELFLWKPFTVSYKNISQPALASFDKKEGRAREKRRERERERGRESERGRGGKE